MDLYLWGCTSGQWPPHGRLDECGLGKQPIGPVPLSREAGEAVAGREENEPELVEHWVYQFHP